MWSVELFHIDSFVLYSYFWIYSFLGWMMESAYVSAKSGRWVNRGFLRGPFCPIYGTGAVCIIVMLTPLMDNLPLLFLGGVLTATVIEYFIGAALEGLFHTTWWDYSGKRFQLHGRICLERSLEWGVLSVLLMQVLQPRIAAFSKAIPRAWGELAGTLLLAYLAIDGTVTVLQILRFNEKLAALSEAHEHLREKLEHTRLYGTRKEILAHFESMTAAEAMRDLKERLEKAGAELEEARLEGRLWREYHKNELLEKMENRMQLLRKSTATERRLLRIYPQMRSKQFDEELQSIKRELEEMRRKKKEKRKDALK